jgi:surfactin synthase thioesterase subunit
MPGLSTTKELFRFLKLENVELKVLNWPKPALNETMQSYAKEMARQIDTSNPYYLIGVSFGGMLCVEISKLLNPQKTILISSCKSERELPPSIKLFRYFPVYKIISENASRSIGRNVRLIVGFKKEFLPDFIKMVNSMPDNYFKSSFDCIVNWKASSLPLKDTVHIHGNADKLLPLKYVNADHIIEGGNHAMIVYKANEISKIINGILCGS